MPIDHALFAGTQARILVKSGRPLAQAAGELLKWIRGMSMFKNASGKPPVRPKKDLRR